MKTHKNRKLCVDPHAVGILNDLTLIIQNWQLSRLFANIVHHSHFIEEHQCQFDLQIIY